MYIFSYRSKQGVNNCKLSAARRWVRVLLSSTDTAAYPPSTLRPPHPRLPPAAPLCLLPPPSLHPSLPPSLLPVSLLPCCLPLSLRACSSLPPALTHFLLKAAGFSLASLSSSIWTCQISRSQPCLVCRTCWQVTLQGGEEPRYPRLGLPGPPAPAGPRPARDPRSRTLQLPKSKNASPPIYLKIMLILRRVYIIQHPRRCGSPPAFNGGSSHYLRAPEHNSGDAQGADRVFNSLREK